MFTVKKDVVAIDVSSQVYLPLVQGMVVVTLQLLSITGDSWLLCSPFLADLPACPDGA